MLVLNLPFKALMFLTLLRPSLVLFLVLWIKLVKDLLKVRCRLALLPFLISFFFQAEDGIRDGRVTGVQTCALPISVVTDGTAVLGLGDIGPEAALPVMEGKAMLFKEFGGVDAFPICLATKDPDEIVATVKAIAPVFGVINLEDISAPRCFEIEERLR